MPDVEGLKLRIIEAVAAHDRQWVKRSEIARHVGRKYLNAADLLMLQLLVNEGVLESRSVETNAPSRQRYEYRIKEG